MNHYAYYEQLTKDRDCVYEVTFTTNKYKNYKRVVDLCRQIEQEERKEDNETQ